MLGPCECKQMGATKLCDSTRKDIHAKYWEMPYDIQQTWLSGQTTSHNPSRIRIREEARRTKRSRASNYFLPNLGEDIQICRRFMLSTLGYTSDSVLCALFNKMTPPASKHGKHEPKHKLPQETINEVKSHINKYNPAVSHYRRAHARTPMKVLTPGVDNSRNVQQL